MVNMGEGEKKEVVVEKKKEEVITIVYRLHIHCDECARVVERHITQHEGATHATWLNYVPCIYLHACFLAN